MVRFFQGKNSSDSTQQPEHDWQAAIDAMDSVVWILDQDFRILQINDSTRKLLGLNEKEIIGRRCWQVVHGSDEPVEDCPAVKAKTRCKRQSLQMEFGRKWFNVIVDPILDARGNFSRAIHIMTDITEQKTLQEQLETSTRLLNNTQHMTKTGGWEWDVRQHKMYWTDELYRLHGFDPADFEAGSASHIDASLQCYQPEDRAVILEMFHACVESGRPYSHLFAFTKATGERIWIRTAAEPVWEDDQIVKVSGHVADVTAFKRIQDKLADQSAWIENLFNAIDDAVFVHPFQEEGFAPFVYVNDTACQRYGYSRREFQQLTALDITDHAEGAEHSSHDHRNELLKSGQLIFEAVHAKKSGQTFPVEINSNIFHQHQQPYILAVVRDISNRKREERRKELLIADLQEALDNIHTLRGLLPLCTQCKKIRDDKGYWNNLESYIQSHSDASISHSLCPECMETLYGGEKWYEELKKNEGKGDDP